jgi:hypothetical protein
MLSGFRLGRVVRTQPASFGSKFCFIRAIRVICGFNFGINTVLRANRRSGHSCRNASTGSMLAARMAG